MTSAKYFNYQGYKIPIHLVNMTGGGADTWDSISQYHMGMYKKYTPIKKTDTILEIGSGVGRDAIQLTKVLSKKGSYIGVDIIRDSILWCQYNITRKYPHFKFIYLDIESQIHNPSGKQKTTDISLPISTNSVDKIILHSVFTHMFEDDITHYLQEFRRILKRDGVILTSFFYLDDTALHAARQANSHLSFRHTYSRDCLVNDPQYPEGAVGYYEPAIRRMLKRSNMILAQPVHLGFWSGRKGASNGQDIFVLRPAHHIFTHLKNSLPFKKTLD